MDKDGYHGYYRDEPFKKRTWVGLTEEEQHQLWKQWIESMDGWGSFYRAIEAKLKEKNR
jgi:hypothetical protein